jgi:hypothetical protein
LPLVVFASWLIINPIFLSKAVDTMADDGPTDLDRMRADLDRLLAAQVNVTH